MPGEDLTNEGRPASIGRPRRLTVTAVVEAAIGLADEVGVEGISMPKLANRLSVGTMTLYGYVDSKRDLLDRMAEHLLQDLHIATDGDWVVNLTRFFSDFRTAALEHPGLADLLASGRVTVPRVFDIVETGLTSMTEAGVEIEEAVRIFYAGLIYTIGFVLWEIPRARAQEGESYTQQWASLLAALDETGFPTLRGAAAGMISTVGSSAQFDWGLHRIIATV